jgi:RNA recognition motif-containing protein
MSNALYITNFPAGTTEDQLRELLAEFGEVIALEIDVEERTATPFALTEMASEKVATKAHRSLNGYRVGEQSLSVSYPEPDPRELTAKQRKAIEEIVATLEETDEVPLRQIDAMARLCGLPFIEALVSEALEVEAREGIMTSDASRRRTKGGVFFYLARYRMSPDVRRLVYNRKGKLEEV